MVSYPARAEAEQAAARLAEGWDKAEVETGVADQGPFVAWAALHGPAAIAQDFPGDVVFMRLRQAVYARELPLLRPQ